MKPTINDVVSLLPVAIINEPFYSRAPAARAECSGSLTYKLAVVARSFHEFSFDFGGSGHENTSNTIIPPVTSAEYQQILAQTFQTSYLQPPQPQPVQDYPQYGSSSILPSQISAPEPSYTLAPTLAPSANLDHAQFSSMQKPRQLSQVAPTHYSSPYESPQSVVYQQTAPSTRKRSFQEDFEYEYPGTQQLQAQAISRATHSPAEFAIAAQLQPSASSYQYPPSRRPSTQQSLDNVSTHSVTQNQSQQQHHHHRLPNQPPPNKVRRTSVSEGGSVVDDDDDVGPPSVVGQPGMPAAAARPKGPKLKFTPEDDGLLVELKETKNLTWKQIADFFPGRSSGTLQVRYCTKLKAKTTIWTDDMVSRASSGCSLMRNGYSD